jgi:hypothetical protein
MKQNSWNRAKRWFAWIGGCALVLALAVGGFWYWINIPPQVKIPTPVMPNPNGYDYFVGAGKAFVWDDKGVDQSTDTEFVKDKLYPLAAKEAWLKQNAKALQLLREGLKYSARQPAVTSFDTNIPEYSKFRGLTRALAVQSHVRAERGNWDGAIQSALEGYSFGNETGRGGPLIGGLVSVAIRAISLRELGNLVSYSNAATAKMTARKMDKLYLDRYPYYKTLENEKWVQITGNLKMMRSSSWQLDVLRKLNDTNTLDLSSKENIQMLFISKRALLNKWTTTMDFLIQNAQQTYPTAQYVSDTGIPPIDALLPVFKRSRWNWARNDTFTVEIMTMYALHAYKLDHGHYPESLSALEPTYLPKIPADPFDGMHSVHYQLQGQKYLLWSIGPDGANNHGNPIVDLDQNSRRYSFTSPDSKGDVVAGINTP